MSWVCDNSGYESKKGDKKEMSKIKTGIDLLKQNPKRIFPALGKNGFLNWIPDESYLKIAFYCETGKKLDLKNPLTFNEKLQWIKLYDRKPEYVTYVDKYAVRDYIKRTIGDEYLIPLIGVYNTVDEIPWGELPNQFVLKCTHGSKSNIICTDKNTLDIANSKKQLAQWMKKNWYWYGREWPYKNLKPQIVCEEFISEDNKIPNDYKIMCFNGKAKLIELHIDRFGDHTQDFYDINWDKTGISQGNTRSNKTIEKPSCLKEMLDYSEVLAKDTYHVRIDWYEVSGKLYFGEITLFDASGFDPFDNTEDNLMLGSWINLDQAWLVL